MLTIDLQDAMQLHCVASYTQRLVLQFRACSNQYQSRVHWMEWCLEKNYWADSECALSALAAAFHPSSFFTACFTPSIFTTTLRPGVVGVCFVVHRWDVMPEWLHIVISGILTGGILGFCKVLCCFSHLRWPCCFFVLWFGSCLFRIDGRCNAWHIRCYRKLSLRANSYSFMACFFSVVFCLVVFLLGFVFGFCFCVFAFCGFLFPLVGFCFAHEAWEYSLDYVQVRNCPLLWPVYLDGHAW